MASKTLQLRNHNHKTLKTLLKPYSNLTRSHLYSSSSSSSSSDNNNNNNNGDNSPKKPTDFSSYFSDIKSRLKNTEQQHYQRQNPLKISESEEIRRNLSEFRRRSNVSAEDLYKRSNTNTNPNPNPNPSTLLKGNTYEGIRESLRQLRGSQVQKRKEVNDPLSLNQYKATFKPSSRTPMAGGGGGGGGGKVYGGSLDSLPIVAFGKELRDKEKKRGEMGKDGGVRDDMESTRFTRFYTYDELGKRLKDLRPEGVEKANGDGDGAEGNWFSLVELNERLVKLREIEENLSQKNGFGILKRSALEVKQQKEEQEQKKAAQRLFILGGLHSIKDSTPKEHLIEKYFHPDNMSSEEKLKLKLKEVRDEFKMHESDCGSARVQIAQLTTEINHLSSVLHKKDKHSRRGLLAKVQQRKKLLKYLRKTDWDSYCFVLSKLSLRDNPDYKN